MHCVSLRHEKNCFLPMRKKGADQLRGNYGADQCFCFLYVDNTIPLLPKAEISSLKPFSVVIQPGLCLTWSKIPKTLVSSPPGSYIQYSYITC